MGDVLQRTMRPEGSSNWNQYTDEWSDTAIESADLITRGLVATGVEREMLFHQAAELLHEDAPWIFLWSDNWIYGVSKKLDWQPRPDTLIFVFDDVVVNP